MKPRLPPSLVALLCRMTLSEQAKCIGITLRSLCRHINTPWERWRVGRADKWCAACGMDFWNLSMEKHREMFKSVPWIRREKKTGRPRDVKKILREVLKAAGIQRPTEKQVEEVAEQFSKL